jgi:phytoene/squalene synthetase
MCLRAFLQGQQPTPGEAERLAHGARRLGAAFQKVNFLRDLDADFTSLGRSYFPGVRVSSFSESDKNRLLDDIDADLGEAAAIVPALPASSRRAVAVAHGIFAELSARLRRTPAELLLRSRVRVPNSVKLRIAADALAGHIPGAAA